MDCTNKITLDDFELENLMKNQISITSSVIKYFNITTWKLQMDEATFHEDIKKIEESIFDISNNIVFVEAKLKTLELSVSPMDCYIFLEVTLYKVLNSITFARLRLIHTSIITP